MRKTETTKEKKQVVKADRLLTVEQLACRWQVSTGGIYNKINHGKLKYIKIFNAVRFKESDIYSYEKRL